MRPIGFSTGALAHADFREGLRLTRISGCPAVELSALREGELLPLVDALESLDLKGLEYVSIHAPSQFQASNERKLCDLLLAQTWRQWPIVVHPDALSDPHGWKEFGSLLCIENMDKRKPIGRTVRELDAVFRQLPEASLCFDIGHARQVDPTMTEAYLILREFGSKLKQVHVSEVSTSSRHEPLSFASILAFQQVAHLIPYDVPLILETPVGEACLLDEIAKVHSALPLCADQLVG